MDTIDVYTKWPRDEKGKVTVELIKEFTILHKGWELDNEAYLVRYPNGQYAIATTSHGGGPYIESVENIHNKIAEYEDILKDTKEALGWVISTL